MNYVPFAPGFLFVKPFTPEGVSDGGVILLPAHNNIPVPMAFVLKTHEDETEIQPGDVVMIQPNAFDTINLGHDETFAVMHKSNVLAVLENYIDG